MSKQNSADELFNEKNEFLFRIENIFHFFIFYLMAIATINVSFNSHNVCSIFFFPKKILF